jgi:hypothetical protein
MSDPQTRVFETSLYPFLVIMILAVIVQFLGEEKLSKMVKYFFPSNVFLFGKELKRYADIQTLRSRLFWGVIVALLVGIAASLVVWAITRG